MGYERAPSSGTMLESGMGFVFKMCD
ncbi:hypothetical protein Gorai_016735 [Gossypium raimondii]|uniref:Uncharacterized protein n=1 Tax=Gossypium raimondii TaxID=29730 RepID=A0A7J8P9N8_GOSRA|nr:hypothetical protein [Gossypium raimondii]